MRRLSLSVVLVCVFTLISLVTFYLVGGYLYANLRTQLLRMDGEEVLIKAQHLRSLVAAEDSAQELQKHVTRFAGQVVGSNAFVVQIRTQDGMKLVDFNPSSLPVSVASLIPDDVPARATDIRQWNSSAGPATHGVAVQAQLHDGEVLTIVVGRSIDDVLGMLNGYRDTILRAMALGAFVAIVLSYILVHRALRPLHDITEEVSHINVEELNVRFSLKNSSPELREIGSSMNEMLARLERGFRLLEQYTENLAHDLRTPVNNLRGQTEVLLSRERSVEEYQALLASNLEEYERLSRMIENILFLTRAGNAQIAVRRTDIDLAEQLQQVAEYFEGLADESGVSLDVRASGTIKADAVLFRRAISNLIANSLRYTPPGGVIELTAALEGGGALISITNPGPEIAAEHLDKIFERFYRIEEARTNSASSTGLGLAIVRSIMELHDGRASAENREGSVRFHLFFPVAAA
jgi:two-component system, OmpR family, heavy metal sensor histidine kinase CusS